MRIGELAKQTGLTASSIRFYESKKLVCTVKRNANGYREYAPETVLILKIIASCQKAGFSLKEIEHLLPQDIGHWQHDKLLEVLNGKIKEIETLQITLAENKKQLCSIVEHIENSPEDLTCEENAKLVLTRLQKDGIV